MGSKFEDKRTPLGTKLVAVIYTEEHPKHTQHTGCGGKFGRSLRHETWFALDWALDVLACTMHENNDEREGPNRDSADIWIHPEGFISLHLWIDALENPDYDMMLVADLKKVDNYNCEEEESFALGDAIYIELMKAYGHWK